MARRRGLGILAAAVTACAIGAAGWVSAQQGGDTTDQPGASSAAKVVAPKPPPGAVDEAPPPIVSAPAGATAPAPAPVASDAADAEPDEDDSGQAVDDEAAAAKPAAPMTRPRYGVAIMQAMDKVTAETMRFEVPVNKPMRYKSLVFTVRACETTAPDEAISDAAAHVEIDSVPIAQQGAVAAPARQVFRGWMFANSPGLNLFENPAYDAWLIACKTASPAA
jgi:hypothetical protein